MILDDIPAFKATKIKSHGLRARQKIVPTIIGLAVVGGIIAATEFGPILVGCPIKGNISNTGQRIYHTPGQEYYTQTRIDWAREVQRVLDKSFHDLDAEIGELFLMVRPAGVNPSKSVNPLMVRATTATNSASLPGKWA